MKVATILSALKGQKMDEKELDDIRDRFRLNDNRRYRDKQQITLRLRKPSLDRAQVIADELGVPRARIFEQGLSDILGQLERAMGKK